MHPHAAGIRIKYGYLGKGAERAAYEMSEIAIDEEAVGQNLVAKYSIHHEPSQIEFHKHCALTQFEAGRLSKKFNDNVDELQRRIGIVLPRIEFLNVWFYVWNDPVVAGGFAAILCEKRLDSSRYKKWNDNKGGVYALNIKLPRDDAVVGEEEEERLGAIDEGDEDEDQEELGPVDASSATRIIDGDVPPAFSHWSWYYTKGHSLVCDLQGVLGKESFQLTDPAIHSISRRFGSTDHSRKGHRLFFATHVCNPLCLALGLMHPGKKADYRNMLKDAERRHCKPAADAAAATAAE